MFRNVAELVELAESKQKKNFNADDRTGNGSNGKKP